MEILKKLRVSRRFALQGAVGGIGVSLWLPILESMCNDHGTAFADRWKVMRERIAAMKEIWMSETPEFHGAFVNFAKCW